MHYKHDFKNAEQILKKGITLAQSTQNIHRRAELEIQYGDLYGYLENKSEAIRHWRNAADCFSSCELYDEILKLVYRGNVFLLEKKLSKVDDILQNLNEFYDKPDCYAFLKTLINDFLSNYLILFSISTNAFDETLHNNVKLILSRYRSVALAYNTNSYMLAAYKTVVYLKYILERHSLSRNETAVVNEQQLILILCEEIIANYSWESSNFTYFFPIFKDIAEVAIKDSMVYKRIIERMPSDKIELFNILAHKSSSIPITAPTLKHGIFNDLDNIVNLLQFSYTW